MQRYPIAPRIGARLNFIKTGLLLFLAVLTFAIPILTGIGGSLFTQHRLTVLAEGGDYDKLAVDITMSTAFEDARNAIKAASSDGEKSSTEMQGQFEQNLAALMSGGRFGNVGMLIGPKGTSKNSDSWSIYQSPISIDNTQIGLYDSLTGGAFSQYKAFGAAVQKLNEKAKKARGSASSLEKGLDEISAAGCQLTNLGARLLKDYNPAPVLLAFIDSSNLTTHPGNKLVAIVNNNENMRNIVHLFGDSTSFGVSMTFLILALIAALLFVASALMTLINGRAAGENVRKAIVKAAVGCVAVPLLAKALDAGVNFLDTVSTAQINGPSSKYVEENLNFADWYACGFSLPDNLTLYINKDGEFELTPEAVRAINTESYRKVHGVSGASDAQMEEKMEQYYSMYMAFPMAVGFSEPVNVAGSLEGKTWRTNDFYTAANNFGHNDPLLQDVEGSGEIGGITYFWANDLIMTSASGDMMYAIQDAGRGRQYGICPIAATNLMRTSFTGSSMTALSGSCYMGSVAFNVDNGEGNTARMDSITRFLATFAMVMAAMKGLFTVIAAGFGGLIGGGAKSAMGSSAGLGQALGGIIALVGGVFGISIIMTMSYTLLDQLFGVMDDLIHGVGGGPDILDPIKEVTDGIPLLGPLLGGVMKSFAGFVLTILCCLTMPKFGGIPITLFCQYLAELPNRFGDRAQNIENKITGDFRGGGGGFGHGGGMFGHGGGMGSSAGAMATKAVQDAKQQGAGMARGLATAGGAILGFGLTKWGQSLQKKHGGKDDSGETDTDKLSMADPENPEEPKEGGTENPDAVKQEEPQTLNPETGESTGEREETGPAGGDGEQEPPTPTMEGTEGQTMAGGGQDGLEGSETVISNDEHPIEENKISGDNLEEVNEAGMEQSLSQEFGGDGEVSETEPPTPSENGPAGADGTSMAGEPGSPGGNGASGGSGSMSGGTGSGSHSSEGTGSGTKMPESNASHSTGTQKPSMANSSSGKGTPQQTPSQTATSQKAPNQPSNGASQADAGRKATVATQKRDRMINAFGKGLETLGGHTTAKQMAAGIGAGMAHTAGSVIGGNAQAVTGRGVDAVRRAKQRQNDIRDHLPPDYSENQRKPANPKGTPNGTQPTGPERQKPANQQVNQREMEQHYREEEMAREEARRRR